MAQITIIPSDKNVGVNGRFYSIDLAGIDADIHAVQFNDASGVGHIEFNDGKPNAEIGRAQFAAFTKYVNAWKAADAPPVRTLDEVKADKRQQINGARDTAEQSGFDYLGKRLDSDQVSVARITVVVQAAQVAIAAGQPFEVTWTAQDNSHLVMDAQQVVGMPIALATNANTLHQRAAQLKAQIDAATTIAEVEAVNW